MKRIIQIATVLLVLSSTNIDLNAGNINRIGEYGASELLMNPWTRGIGMGGSNSSSLTGVDALQYNVAGLASVENFQLLFNNTSWLVGSGTNINAMGLAARLGEDATSVLGFTVMSVGFGDIPVTTADNPEGDGSTFSPQFMNLGLSFAKEFSNSIYGGVQLKMISEGISDAKTQGMAIDAGVKYITGDYEQLKFGIALRNVGPPMRYSGDGFSIASTIDGTELSLAVDQRSAKFELPSLLNIGLSYDFRLMVDSSDESMHRLTAAGTFTSNSFNYDQYRLGLEYGFKEMVMIRASYILEKGLFDASLRKTAFTGPAAGASLDIPLGKDGTSIGFDFSYRFTQSFSGITSIGARINL